MNKQMYLTLDLKDGSILLSEGLIDALDRPRQVQLLVNREEKMLLLRACSVRASNAVVISSGLVEQFEISGRSFLKKLKAEIGWTDDRPRLCYGEYLSTHQAIRFDLTKTEPLDYLMN